MSSSDAGEIGPGRENVIAEREENANQRNDETIQQDATPPPPAANSFWSILKGIAVRFFVIYLISSFFRRGQTPATTPTSGSKPMNMPSSNLYENGTIMDMFVYVSEDAFQPDFQKEMVWSMKGLIYGDWTGGPENDGIHYHNSSVTISKNVQNNGSIWIHIYLVEGGRNPIPGQESYSEIFTVHKKKQLNRFKKRRYKKMHNLLTGETTTSDEALEKMALNISEEVISHWHPNLTINIIDDHTPWVMGSVPAPMDEYIEFEPRTGKYYPVIYINDYWNLMRDYQPINNTVKSLNLQLVYQPLSMFRWQMYTAQAMRNKWSSMLGSSMMEDSDEDQDTVKLAFLETSPYLLGLTLLISVTHSVFEFMAFKNDIQFWKNRKSLEGLSVRSIFFNVFQSVIVLLYVMDNDTNTVVKISIGIGLLIEMWKIHKVVDIKLNYDEKIFGFIPKITYTDKGSYIESSTKQYDMLAFRYLSWIFFPLLVGYAIYSLIYLEHKGFYSWVLSMLYGFLLTFGFIAMTPQLFINYKLKSIAHLPWRMLSYKFLNTFIDDIFAFVIKMPTLYRIGCFRDDIVFLIFLYQKWIYRVDYKRVNEFGVSGEDLADANGENESQNGSLPIEENKKEK